MWTPRLALTLALLLGGLLAPAPVAQAVAPGTWTPAAPMNYEREGGHSATLLPNGRVLIVGSLNWTDPPPAELYDPATDRWLLAGKVITPREGPLVVRLATGKVLVTGGTVAVPCSSGAHTYSCRRTIATSELYDPATDMWGIAAPAPTARQAAGVAATTLADGRVLVVGGDSADPDGALRLGTAELYDPATDHWLAVAAMHEGRTEHTATLLPDGRVLVVGGWGNVADPAAQALATAELYDPPTGRWTPTAPLGTGRRDHRATPLADGRVLVVGGTDNAGQLLATAEVYDPATNHWAPAGALGSARAGHTATLLPDGTVLVVGGVGQGGSERYDPTANRWIGDAPLGTPRSGHAATLLSDGRVLVIGGTNGQRDAAERIAELYGPAPMLEACFQETNQCVRGRFLAYWTTNGGLARNGFPLGTERQETLEDGKEYTVQYFERVRLELHPENTPPYDVLLGQFGRRVSGIYMTDPSKPQPGRVFFPETGHNLFARFLAYWQENGGLARFGYPLSEEYGQRLEDGQSYTVQYFERARFEYHPENPRPYDVLLGQFGRRILAENDVLGVPERAGFGLLYITNEEVRRSVGRLAPPTERAIEAPGAYQTFEHGALLYRGDLRRIYVLCGDPARGTLLRPTTFVPGDPLGENLGGASFPDTWEPGQPSGGGPGPRLGLYEPTHGFGKLWREDARVRDCLGYATDPAETAYTLRMQPFPVSAMFSATTPQGRFIYVVVWSGWNHPSSCALESCRPDYTRYPDPGR